MAYLYKVGTLYHPERTQWPERTEYNYRDGAHELRMFIANLTPREIRAVKAGRAEFGVFGYWSAIFFLYRFHDEHGVAAFEGSCPYTIWAVPEDQRGLPEDPPEGQGATLVVFLVEATTGILKAIRVVGLSHRFTLILNGLIRSQHAYPFDQARYNRDVDLAYARYPNDWQMFRAAETCVAGMSI